MIFLLTSAFLFAEPDPRSLPLSSERPDLTDSADVVGQGVFQAEGGFTHSHIGDQKQTSAPDLLLRYGVGRRSEFRLVVPTYIWSDANGLSDIGISYKIRTSLGHGQMGLNLHPKSAITFQGTLATGKVGEPYFQPGVKAAFAWDLSPKLSVTSNIVADWASVNGEQFLRFTETASFEYVLTEKLHSILEFYAITPGSRHGDNQKYITSGLTYLVSNNLQLDVLGGTGLNGISPDHYITVGISRRW